MRIALVNSIRFYGGGEKRVLRGAYEFRRRGHEVTVLGQPDAELGSRCRAEAIPYRPVLLRGYTSPRTVSALDSALEAVRPDVLVCYDERSVRVAALASRLRFRAPLVYYYGLEGSFKNKAYNRLVVAPRIARYVANAEAVGRELLSFGWVPAERLSVIYDGVDPAPILEADPTGIREELAAAPEDVVVLTVARLVAEKGHAVLLEAVAKLPERARVRVWIAGEGPETEALSRQASALGLAGRVTLLGFRPDVPRLLRAADVLCHPSRREGAPNAVREAMVAGLPVAATAASGTPELVAEGVTGFLSPIDDAAALARNLDRLATDAGLRQRMGEAGRERALAEFSEARCAERWLEVLGELTTKARTTQR